LSAAYGGYPTGELVMFGWSVVALLVIASIMIANRSKNEI